MEVLLDFKAFGCDDQNQPTTAIVIA